MRRTWIDEMGPAVREVRERRAMTQQQLATRAGCSVVYVASIERGRKRLGLDLIEPIARALRFSVWRLVQRAYERAKQKNKGETDDETMESFVRQFETSR